MSSGGLSILTALLTAGVSLVVAIVAWLAARSNQARLLASEHERQHERLYFQGLLAQLQVALDERKSERDARRDYEYEARKRLYHECSPLLFQLVDQAAAAFERIRGLAETAAQGHLGAGGESWLTSQRHRYYRISTEYRLLAPLATFKLLQRRLTRLDLSLDAGIHLAHVLARQASRALGDDFELARLNSPSLCYEPHRSDAERLRQQQPRIYWQQGVPRGILDNAVEALLVHDGDDGPRVMTFLEFESQVTQPGTVVNFALNRIGYLLADFHPRDRPILWRLLLVMASIARALGVLAESEHARLPLPDARQLLLIPAAERERFDWRSADADTADAALLAEAFAAVDAYLLRELENPLQAIIHPAGRQ